MNMNCEEIQSALIESYGEEMDPSLQAQITTHLLTCTACAQEAGEWKTLLQLMAASPMAMPGPALKDNFDHMLRAESEKLAAAGRLKDASPPAPDPVSQKDTAAVQTLQDASYRQRPQARILGIASWGKVAAVFLILVAGIWIGTQLPASLRRPLAGSASSGQTPDSTRGELTGLKNEVKDMKETLLFALLKEESASQRIRAVSYTEDISNPDISIIDALVNTLNHDKNVNVRLASLYSLARFPNNAAIRDSLVRSLGRQTEPIVQIVLIDLLTEMKEPGAIKPIQDILSDEKTLPDVKTIARKGLQIL